MRQRIVSRAFTSHSLAFKAKSAVDATRFTATAPHAYSKPISNRATTISSENVQPRSSPGSGSVHVSSASIPRPSRSSSPNTTPSPHNTQSSRVVETPQQKVARLRAARLKAREAEFSRWDRVVMRGRDWADRVHRVAAISLISLTVVAGGVTAFALSDMVMHNRRKRTAFYNEQHLIYTQRLLSAIETEKAGIPLTTDQRLVINRERAKVQAEEEKKKRSWRHKFSEGIFGATQTDVKSSDAESGVDKAMALPEIDEKTGFEGGAVPSEGDILDMIGVDRMRVLEQTGGKAVFDGRGTISVKEETKNVAGSRDSPRSRQTGSSGQDSGGPLDIMAAQAATILTDTPSSWFKSVR